MFIHLCPGFPPLDIVILGIDVHTMAERQIPPTRRVGMGRAAFPISPPSKELSAPA
jgi:hypothetical protein